MSKRVRLNFPIRVNGKPRKAGATVTMADSDYNFLRHRKRGGVPLLELASAPRRSSRAKETPPDDPNDDPNDPGDDDPGDDEVDASPKN